MLGSKGRGDAPDAALVLAQGRRRHRSEPVAGERDVDALGAKMRKVT